MCSFQFRGLGGRGEGERLLLGKPIPFRDEAARSQRPYKKKKKKKTEIHLGLNSCLNNEVFGLWSHLVLSRDLFIGLRALIPTGTA